MTALSPGSRAKILAGTYKGQWATVKEAGWYVQIDGQTTVRPYRESSLEAAAPAPEPAPEPTPPAGATVRPGDSVAEFLGDLADGATGYFRGGNYTDSSVSLTKRGVTLKAYPGEKPAWRGGQFRVYGEANTIDGIDFPAQNTAGSSKDLEISGADHKLLNSYLANNYTEIKVAAGHGAGPVLRLLVEGCWFDKIGNLTQTNIFDHALYFATSEDCIVRNNRFSNVRGGYCVHGYKSMMRTKFENNRIWNSYALVSDTYSRDTIMRNNACQWDLTDARRAPNGRVGNGGTATIEHNVLWSAAGSYGQDGISEASGLTVRDNLIRSPKFANPAAGDFTITDAEARAFLGV